MSEAFYPSGGLRFWSQREIEFREEAVKRISSTILDTLKNVNFAWDNVRCEGPILTPSTCLSSSYDNKDVWELNAEIAGQTTYLRPETTASSYLYAQHILKNTKHKLPFCVWQAGKSFRRETNDGASPSKLRFFEFWQLEFQCLFASGTKTDYRAALLPVLTKETELLTGLQTRIVASDRLPEYSKETLDIEVLRKNGRWTEVCSISLRTDNPMAECLEIAFGLDRLVCVYNESRNN